jgi:hypothetical protein
VQVPERRGRRGASQGEEQEQDQAADAGVLLPEEAEDAVVGGHVSRGMRMKRIIQAGRSGRWSA